MGELCIFHAAHGQANAFFLKEFPDIPDLGSIELMSSS